MLSNFNMNPNQGKYTMSPDVSLFNYYFQKKFNRNDVDFQNKLKPIEINYSHQLSTLKIVKYATNFTCNNLDSSKSIVCESIVATFDNVYFQSCMGFTV